MDGAPGHNALGGDAGADAGVDKARARDAVTHATQAPGAAPSVARPSRLCSDGYRALVALACSIVVPLLVGMIIGIIQPSIARTTATTVALFLLGWNVFVVAYLLLMQRTFAKVDSAEFQVRMAARGARPSRFWTFVSRSGDGPTFAIESTIVAFSVVLVLPHINAIAIDDWLLVPLTLTILFSCWLLAVYSYALHYAQHDLSQPGLDFPGDRSRAFADYVYFSIAVATTFGATDVSITTPSMRRIVNVHVVITFLYNTVIVALLVSLLIR